MDDLGKPKRRWDVVEERGIKMDHSMPCKLCRTPAIGAGGGCCADCMISVILNPAFKKLIEDKRKRL
jgi:hypothetical protein